MGSQHPSPNVKNLCNFEPQIWPEIITSRDAKSTCLKGLRTSSNVIMFCVLGANLNLDGKITSRDGFSTGAAAITWIAWVKSVLSSHTRSCVQLRLSLCNSAIWHFKRSFAFMVPTHGTPHLPVSQVGLKCRKLHAPHLAHRYRIPKTLSTT